MLVKHLICKTESNSVPRQISTFLGSKVNVDFDVKVRKRGAFSFCHSFIISYYILLFHFVIYHFQIDIELNKILCVKFVVGTRLCIQNN